MGISIKTGILYKKTDLGFCSLEIPTGWEARYVRVDGVDQKNLILICSALDMLPDGSCANSFTCQVSALNEALTPQLCIDIENSVNPGCTGVRTTAMTISGQKAIVVEAQEYPFDVLTCRLFTAYIQNPKTHETYRFGYWYETTKENTYQAILEHMLQTVRINDSVPGRNQ